jgi:hypothetical protein
MQNNATAHTANSYVAELGEVFDERAVKSKIVTNVPSKPGMQVRKPWCR